MKWAIAAIALVVVANGIVLVSAGRDRAAPPPRDDRRLRRTPDRRRDLDEPPALRLESPRSRSRLQRDSTRPGSGPWCLAKR
jgi:hypothetical protein